MVLAGLLTFLNRAVKDADKLDRLRAGDSAAPALMPGWDVERAMLAFSSLAPPPKKEEPKEVKVHINLGEEIGKLTLEKLPQAAWPSPEAVDKLATEVQRQKKKGHDAPFVRLLYSASTHSVCITKMCIARSLWT